MRICLPAPTRVSCNTIHIENAKGDESAESTGHGCRNEEVGDTETDLLAFVPVALSANRARHCTDSRITHQFASINVRLGNRKPCSGHSSASFLDTPPASQRLTYFKCS